MTRCFRLVHPLTVAPSEAGCLERKLTNRLEDSSMAAKKGKKAAKKPAVKKTPAKRKPSGGKAKAKTRS